MLDSKLEVIAKYKGFESLQHYLKDQYEVQGFSQEAIAMDLDISINKLRQLFDRYHISKQKREIPLTLKDAKRMGPDAIAKAHGVSRSTAWRWKRAILDREKYREDS